MLSAVSKTIGIKARHATLLRTGSAQVPDCRAIRPKNKARVEMANQMEQLIPIVNRIQDTFTSIGMPLAFDLPQIAVVGSQSAGKSSVLENIVGRDFLPRGSGIVTRRPLVLQLIQHQTEYAEFLHVRDKKFTDFDKVRREIEAETDRLTGSNKNISSLPINLRVYSPHVLNLTLIDLPGITKVPIGDQPPDIEVKIRKMIEEFIKPQSCLILAVTPANSDLANSDALKLARDVDPQGIRTIGVLTKLDLMDSGTDAREILENKVLPLRRGFVGVVNRSQKDIDGKKNISEALESERKFFATHPVYSTMLERCGTLCLQKLLNQELTNHIKESLPELTRRLQGVMATLGPKVAEYKKLGNEGSMKNKILSQLINTFCNEFGNELSGCTAMTGVDMSNLSGGARINRIFHERLPFEVHKLQQNERKARQEIAIAIRNIHGINIGLFTPDMAFEAVVRSRISNLREPSLQCVDLVVRELQTIVYKIGEKLSRYPSLRYEIERIANEEIKRLEVETKEQVEMQIRIQLAYMNTNHDDFVGISEVVQRMQPMDTKAGQVPLTGTPVSSQMQLPAQLQPAMGVQVTVIRKGYLSLLTTGMLKTSGKELWFVLTKDSLTAFSASDEKDRKFAVNLDGLRLKDTESGGIFSKKYAFALFYPERMEGSTANLLASSRTVYKDQKQLELCAVNQDELENWKASFLRANVYPEVRQEKDTVVEEPEFRENPNLERQVDLVSALVESYCRIVTKMHRDIVPKTIACTLVNKMREFLQSELYLQLYSNEKLEEFMKESPAEKKTREDTMNMFVAVKDALQIISDVNMTTVATPLPPPIHSDKVVPMRSATTASQLIPSRRAPAPPAEKSAK